MSKLVIVESPAKAKTIKKYLGPGYEVVASMGHIRDLNPNRLSVDIKKKFAPKYELIKGKEKLADELIKLAEKSDYVYLATDPDREGEAISWHLAYLLGLDLEDNNRVTFNEITGTGVKNGMASPRKIDIDLVNAQQAAGLAEAMTNWEPAPEELFKEPDKVEAASTKPHPGPTPDTAAAKARAMLLSGYSIEEVSRDTGLGKRAVELVREMSRHELEKVQ